MGSRVARRAKRSVEMRRAERRARGERVMVEWGGVSKSCRRRRGRMGMMWLERARGEVQTEKMGKGVRGMQGERTTDK